ncbi:MAG: hypothetical protein SO314_07480 [Alphaproteobacteria bacterium]|nr:hypothetical protein [Alphaproteobacteria bacterium]
MKKSLFYVLTLLTAMVLSSQAFAETTFLPDDEEGGDSSNYTLRMTENLN